MQIKLNIVGISPENTFGKNEITVKMVTLLDDNGKYIKHLPIDESVVNMLSKGIIEIPAERYDYYLKMNEEPL
jgi:hypothetical protein